MSKEIKIQRVSNNQVEELRTLGEETFRETFEAQNSKENLATYLTKSFSLTSVQAQLASPHSEFYFASKNDEILGYLKLNTSEEGLEIERIYVRGSAQGQGIGIALYEFTLEIAKARKSVWLWLGVWQGNKKAISFYEHNGLEIYKTRQFKLGDQLHDDFLMRLRIS